MVRKIYAPIQIFLDVLRRRRSQRKMMWYVLKINRTHDSYS